MSENYILAVDDDPEVLGTVSRALSREGFTVRQASSGAEALDILEREGIPELMLLDIIMPGMDGLEVCKRLRSDNTYNRLPILFLSARSQTDEVVEGLDAGGDDYLIKPFELTELHARIRALLRRAQREAQGATTILTVGELVLDSNTHQAELPPSKTIQLTATEHKLLRYLMENVNQALSPTHLLQAVWSYPPDTGDPDLVRAHIRNLRAKVEDDSNNPKYIRTIHGVGYMISDQQD